YPPAAGIAQDFASFPSLAPVKTLLCGMRIFMKTSRRRFLGTTASAVTAFTIVPRSLLGGPKFVPPSEKINIALVGAGGQGRTNARALFPHADAQIIAIADPVDSVSLEEFYFKGEGGRLPVKAEVEKHYSEKTPNFRC